MRKYFLSKLLVSNIIFCYWYKNFFSNIFFFSQKKFLALNKDPILAP